MGGDNRAEVPPVECDERFAIQALRQCHDRSVGRADRKVRVSTHQFRNSCPISWFGSGHFEFHEPFEKSSFDERTALALYQVCGFGDAQRGDDEVEGWI